MERYTYYGLAWSTETYGYKMHEFHVFSSNSLPAIEEALEYYSQACNVILPDYKIIKVFWEKWNKRNVAEPPAMIAVHGGGFDKYTYTWTRFWEDLCNDFYPCRKHIVEAQNWAII